MEQHHSTTNTTPEWNPPTSDDDEPRASESADDVGYCKPPKSTQFKKGASGNPKGRPKKPKFKFLGDAIGAKLDEQVTVTVDGSKRKFSRLRLLVRNLVEEAANGNRAALIEIVRISEADEGEAPPTEPDWLIVRYSEGLAASSTEKFTEAFYQQHEKDVAQWTKEARNGSRSIKAMLHLELIRKVPAIKAGRAVKVPMYEVIAARFLKDATSDVATFKLLQKIVPQKKYKRDYTRIEYLRPTQAELDSYGGTAKPRAPIPGIDSDYSDMSPPADRGNPDEEMQ